MRVGGCLSSIEPKRVRGQNGMKLTFCGYSGNRQKCPSRVECLKNNSFRKKMSVGCGRDRVQGVFLTRAKLGNSPSHGKLNT
jgi:hypothetical protein